MSNNLVSQRLLLLDMQTGQMEPVSDKLDSSMQNMGVEMMGPVSSNPVRHEFPVSSQHMDIVEPMSNDIGSQSFTMLNKQMGQMDTKVGYLGPRQFFMPNQRVGEVGGMLNNIGLQKSLLPAKRKADVEPMFINSVAQQPSMLNKRVAQMEPFLQTPGLQQQSVPNKKPVQTKSLFSAQNLQISTPPSKKMARNESISNKSGSQRVHTPKGRTLQVEPSPKVQNESSAVRSKMRESLATALALPCPHQDKASNEEKISGSGEAITSQQKREDSQIAESTSTPVDTFSHLPEDATSSKESCSADKSNDSQSTSGHAFANESVENSGQTYKSSVPGYECGTSFPEEDASFSDNFFVKDDLLQGNGLSWALDLDMSVSERKEVQADEKSKVVYEDVGGDGDKQEVRSTRDLALKIEAELYKLFGGVNKKYKEKGRSLLFNLKDQSNPELRERVMSGDISPEKLCSMTAEELASKELSEWRVAKAEEFAHMVVLPDSDVDIRRLVKKTHKGEYQVEFEHDDGVSVEVSLGTTLLNHNRPKRKEMGTRSPSEADEVKDRENTVGEKSRFENHDVPDHLTIPNDGTDLMQGLMVDELKDAEFLPPIVSLDEFMESLNSEPPFESLQVDGGQTILLQEKENSKTGNELVATDLASKDHVDATLDRTKKVDLKHTKLEVDVKPNASTVERKISPVVASKVEHVWEGVLQLNITALVTAVGFFRSGEKTSTKEWSSSIEIKGRVRPDAFEKFLQELPMSRSRAVMVVNFVLKEGSTENERASLCEAVDSYVLDERLGFAEPVMGMEIYFCPPRGRIFEMICKHLLKDGTEILNSTDNGLIGVVVWRKAHLSSTISPNSSSHHKHGSKKQHFTSRGQHHEKDTNVNVNLTPRGFDPPRTNPEPPPDDDDDDDIPPGFGPPAARGDDDDLPEFNFSEPELSSQNHPKGSRMAFHSPSQASSGPAEQLRALVHMYGQAGAGDSPRNWSENRGVGHGKQPWNDDDDIPEWQPETPQQQLQPQPTIHGFNQPIQPLMQLGTPVLPISIQPQQNVAQFGHYGAAWVQPSVPGGVRPNSNIGNQPMAGQYYPGFDRRQDAPRSRGF